MSEHNNPRERTREANSDANEKEEHLGAIDYIRRHKIRSSLVTIFLFSLGGPLNFYGSNPNIFYFPAIVACACILYFTHAHVTSLKRAAKPRPTTIDQVNSPALSPTPTPPMQNTNINTGTNSGFIGQNFGGNVTLGPKRREITASQETAILTDLVGAPTGKVEISVTESDLEAVALARRIESILTKAGNQVHVSLVMMMSGPMGAPVGLGLTIKDDKAVPPHAQAIGDALGKAGLISAGSTNADRDGDTLYIVVGVKPLDP